MKRYERAKQIMQIRLSTKEAYHPGFFIRDKRLSLKLKLDDFTSLCTPSTLSKIETGKLTPNPTLLNALYQHLDLPNQPTPPKKNWLHPIRHTIYQREFSFSPLNQENMNLHYQQSLVKFSFFVLSKDIIHAKRELFFLEKMLIYFSLDELQYYFLFIGYYYHLLFEGQLSKNYYDLSYQLTIKCKQNEPLLFLFLARHYSLTHHSLTAVQFAYEASALFLKSYALSYVIECELLISKEYINTRLFSTAYPILEKIKNTLSLKDPHYQIPTLYNRYGDYYFALRDYPKAEKMYVHSLTLQSKNEEAITALMDLYYHSQQLSKLRNLLHQLKNSPSSISHPYHLKWKFYHYLINPPLSDSFRIFLQSEAIPLAKKQQDRQGLELYSTHLQSFYEKNHKYKAALHTLKMLNEQREFLKMG